MSAENKSVFDNVLKKIKFDQVELQFVTNFK